MILAMWELGDRDSARAIRARASQMQNTTVFCIMLLKA
jgi:hypothetical protein